MHRKLRLAAFVLIPIGLASCLRAPDPRSAIDGQWEPVRVEVAAERPALRYGIADDQLQMSSSAGESYSAETGGEAVALEGAPAGTTVSVEQVPAVAYREVVSRNGRPVAVRIVTIADRQVATLFENRLDGSASVYIARRR